MSTQPSHHNPRSLRRDSLSDSASGRKSHRSSDSSDTNSQSSSVSIQDLNVASLDADLRSVERSCTAKLARCNEHEREIEALRHVIESRIQRWTAINTALQQYDAKAGVLASQLDATLATMRNSAQPQVKQASDAAEQAAQRVTVSRDKLREAEHAISEAQALITRLEQRLVDEESMLQRISWTSHVVFWLVSVFLLGLALLIAWQSKVFVGDFSDRRYSIYRQPLKI